MVVNVGIDLVKISRLKTWIQNQALLERYFLREEIDRVLPKKHGSLESLAGIFAAKEAFIKAVRKAVTLKDVVVEKDVQGAPRLRLERSASKAMSACVASHALLSISHEKEYAIATVLLCR